MTTKRIPTHIGDVLIFRTTQSYTMYAVGRVSKDGQQDFGIHPDIKHATNHAAAVAEAKALVAPGGKIFLQNIDTDEWSEISPPPRSTSALTRFTSHRDYLARLINGFQVPIVCSPRDAVRVFFGTGIDALVLGQFVLALKSK